MTYLWQGFCWAGGVFLFFLMCMALVVFGLLCIRVYSDIDYAKYRLKKMEEEYNKKVDNEHTQV